ncbi:hypothetical protein V6N13_062219 [Hibiscus sabdariffa]|uniref:Uncharacterized protein n=1 Tax=Hibiscus sabdariffa TaxID=183260 RepID=A0ABR2NAW0_9ROSI
MHIFLFAWIITLFLEIGTSAYFIPVYFDIHQNFSRIVIGFSQEEANKETRDRLQHKTTLLQKLPPR